MPVQPDSQNPRQHAEELINDLKASNGRGSKLANESGRLLLQTVSFRKPNRRKGDDEQGHQPVVRERATKHVDNAFLARLGEEGKCLKYAFAREERQPCPDASHY